MDNQLVAFKLAQEYFAVDIAVVAGIIKLQPITRVPRAPECVRGITNLRGKVLPVIDLRRRFGLPPEAATADTRIVIVEQAGVSVGMVVDGVSEVLRIDPAAIEPPSEIVTTVDSAFIRGIAKQDERLIILLNLEQVLQVHALAATPVPEEALAETELAAA